MDMEYKYAVKKEGSCKSFHKRQVNAHSSTQRGFANQETPRTVSLNFFGIICQHLDSHTINYAETI